MNLKPPGNDDRCVRNKWNYSARWVPFGYRLHPDDPAWLIPVPKDIEAMDQAMTYIESSSLRAIAEWLSNKIGRKISHMAIKREMKRRGIKNAFTKWAGN